MTVVEDDPLLDTLVDPDSDVDAETDAVVLPLADLDRLVELV